MKGILHFFVIFFVLFFGYILFSGFSDFSPMLGDREFNLISSSSNSYFDEELIEYAKKNRIKLNIDHAGDLEIVDILNDDNNYDGVWMSNSLWLYMLDNSYSVTNTKSIATDPVVMAIKKSKAEELGFVSKDVYNKDILNAVASGNLKYVMTSVTQTNTGATAYLGFVNSLAGSPEVLTEEMLDNQKLISDLKNFFKGVERVSGDEKYTTEMFLNGEYEAIINYESSLIQLNKQLVEEGKEPLYLIYPVDGVALNDMPFGYVSRRQGSKSEEQFKLLQSFLRSKETASRLEELGFRTWYGGIKNTNSSVFNPEWGIDTNEYLVSLKYPSKKVMTKALNLYITALRKPTHVVFLLDVSGSMYGDGLDQLKGAMNYILDEEQTAVDLLQFSEYDKITVITFNGRIDTVYDTCNGNDTNKLKSKIDRLFATGGTNIYDPSIKALEILKGYSASEYTRTVILMTDGQSNNGSYRELANYYNSLRQEIPIYSITFGDADEAQLQDIANLTNAKVFNGRDDLKAAFKEVRGYN